MKREEAIEFIINKLITGERKLEQIKREAGHKYKLLRMITNPELIENFPKDKLTPEIRKLLLKKPTKTLSGVTPVAVMIKPEESCKWNCIYCPFTGLAAKSYVGLEPAAMRARQYSFDPYEQASGRVAMFEGGGHAADKCEVIIMGGTFLGMDKEYKYHFIKGVYEGLNGKRANTLEEAIKTNETAKHRAIGLTLETRPDVCTEYIDEMLSYGATRVELGVQHADDQIYKLINRGHKVEDVISATKSLKNAAFKVLYHIMPGLPGSNKEKDTEFVKTLFENPDFRPDMLKIYPTLVTENTILYEWMKQGKYRPYSTEEAADIISEFYYHIPKYVRVMRIQRDIPAQKIESGVRKSNLRELVEQKLKEKRITPKEIRYREVGLNKEKAPLEEFKLDVLKYHASGGEEYFISYENNAGLIAGFIRLRIIDNSALIRELHVYGSEVPINKEGQIQHKGIGSKLLKKAEEIAADKGKTSMLIISGVGARQYYTKHGYSLKGHYMKKSL